MRVESMIVRGSMGEGFCQSLSFLIINLCLLSYTRALSSHSSRRRNGMTCCINTKREPRGTELSHDTLSSYHPTHRSLFPFVPRPLSLFLVQHERKGIASERAPLSSATNQRTRTKIFADVKIILRQ